jgi:NAD-dependent dihydropyrimidine dehydrogenase PreA subunit
VNAQRIRSLTAIVILIALIIPLSLLSVRLWGGKPEKVEVPAHLTLHPDMTVEQVAETNELPTELLKRAFDLQPGQGQKATLADLGLSAEQAQTRIIQASAIASEESTKDWRKIFIKFALWIAFLIIPFVLMLRARVGPKARKWLLGAAVVLFGLALGSDPSPMGTVKDAIILYGAHKAVFPPRMVALAVFLLLVIVANKYICAWGCQFGVLQDLVHRLARKPNDRKGVFPQFKPPFVLTNTVRIITLAALTVVAFLWAYDIIEPVDPFRIYNPAHLGIAGGIAVGVLLIASIFIWRPWCHFFCPFGLVGWVFEKLSVFKITVNYETCVRCETCAKTCPSTVMGAILKRNRVIPDCFACSSCIDVCPTGSISFRARRRTLPPPGEWDAGVERQQA